MNVEIRAVAAQFLFREYLFQTFGIGSLQCVGDWKGGGRRQKERESLNKSIWILRVDKSVLK